MRLEEKVNGKWRFYSLVIPQGKSRNWAAGLIAESPDRWRLANETVYEVSSEIVTHQIEGDMHRLVHCVKPPQIAGEWVTKDQNATVGTYVATFEGGVIGGKVVPL